MGARITHSFLDGAGEATYEPGSRVSVGNRRVPDVITVRIRGDGAHRPDYHMRIEVLQGVPRWTEVTLRSRDGGPEVRPKDLAVIRLDDWLEEVVALCSSIDGGKPLHDLTALSDIRRIRSGRPRITRQQLQQVAAIYRANADQRPTEAVAVAFGKDHRTAARYVRRARDAGLLPDTTRGKARAQ